MLQQVKVKNWVDGKEGDMLNGMTATFGSFLPEDADQTHKAPLLYAIPNDCCSLSTSKVFLIYTSINSIFIMFSHSFIHSFTSHFSYLDQLLFVFVVTVTTQLKLHSHSQGVLLLS